MSRYRIDRASGHVYTEKVMAPAVGFSSGPSWVHESPFLHVDYEERSPSGVPTLKHLATKQTLRDQRKLTPSHFVNVPWPIARHLWDYLGRSGKRTMYMWKVFCTAYPIEFSKVSKYCEMVIDPPQMPMRDYLSLVKDDACSWVVGLTVCTEYARTPELVEVANVENIVALEISTPSLAPLTDEDVEIAALSDRIIRAWSELAETSGAFKHLRVLRLYGQQSLSGIIFQYFDSFPSLRVCIAANCSGITSQSAVELARTYGWQVETGRELWERYERPAGHKSGTGVSWDGGNRNQTITPPAHKDTPLLDFKIGLSWEIPRSDSQRIVFWRQEPDETGKTSMGMKRRKDTNLNVGEGGMEPRKRTKKPVMKDARKKDLSGLLAEFS
ncbi:hypothetical protein VTN77DRAFT_1282 [Rasamsonia byssochlamydoides]|uniref:uncharacterized protein n=1 Tax=Rasamsonia byssochlamydoides TaxID=89139 RepID=UPI0037442DB3